MTVHVSPFAGIAEPDVPLHEYVLAALTESWAAAGVGPGAVVAVFAPNSVRYPAACFAVSRLGAAVTPVNALSTAGELAAQLADSGATHLLLAAALLPAAATAQLPPTVREVLVLDGPAAGYRSLTDLAAGAPPAPVP